MTPLCSTILNFCWAVGNFFGPVGDLPPLAVLVLAPDLGIEFFIGDSDLVRRDIFEAGAFFYLCFCILLSVFSAHVISGPGACDLLTGMDSIDSLDSIDLIFWIYSLSWNRLTSASTPYFLSSFSSSIGSNFLMNSWIIINPPPTLT